MHPVGEREATRKKARRAAKEKRAAEDAVFKR